LFQSDHDYDIVDELNVEAGLRKLEDEAKAKAEAVKKSQVKGKALKGEHDPNNDDNDDIYYAVYASLCSDIDLVRKHLEAGVLSKLIDKYTAKMTGPKDKWGLTPPGYTVILLGACAMSLGCTLPDSFLALLKANYTKVGLMRDALTQMKKALYGPNGAKAGVPYDFGSLGLDDTMAAGGPPDEDTLYPESKYGKSGIKSMNCPSPGGLPPLPPDVMAKLRAQMGTFREEGKFPDGVCNGCGAKEKKGGGALLACAKCKVKKYCGRECQTKMWKVHKFVCEPAAAPAAGGKEN